MAKSVKGTAFHFGDTFTAKDLTAADFTAWLEARHGVTGWPFAFRHPSRRPPKVTRRCFFDKDADYFCGLIVTSHGDKHDHYEEQRGGKTFIVQREIKGAPPVQLNFFAIRIDTENGIYTSYRGSYSFGDFLTDIWRAYCAFAEEATGNSQRKLKLFERFNTTPLVNRESFKNLVGQMSQVFEVRVSTPDAMAPEEAPEEPDIKGSTHVYRLGDNAPGKKFFSWVNWLRLKSFKNKRHHGAVIGAKPGGERMSVNFGDTLDDHLQIPYDALGDVDTESVMAHDVIQRLIVRLKGNALFSGNYREHK